MEQPHRTFRLNVILNLFHPNNRVALNRRSAFFTKAFLHCLVWIEANKHDVKLTSKVAFLRWKLDKPIFSHHPSQWDAMLEQDIFNVCTNQQLVEYKSIISAFKVESIQEVIDILTKDFENKVQV